MSHIHQNSLLSSLRTGLSVFHSCSFSLQLEERKHAPLTCSFSLQLEERKLAPPYLFPPLSSTMADDRERIDVHLDEEDREEQLQSEITDPHARERQLLEAQQQAQSDASQGKQQQFLPLDRQQQQFDGQRQYTPDFRIPLDKFHGKPDEDSNTWAKTFRQWCTVRQIPEKTQSTIMPLYFRGQASRWYNSLLAPTMLPIAALLKGFTDEFAPQIPFSQLLINIKQPSQTVRAYYYHMLQLKNDSPMNPSDGMLASIFVNGLLPPIRDRCMDSDLSTLDELKKLALRKEAHIAAYGLVFNSINHLTHNLL